MFLKEEQQADGSFKVVPTDTMDQDRWRVCTEIKGYLVSTVFLGMVHSGGPYETMVFKGEDRSELDFDRYESREEAIKGHERIANKWRDKLIAHLDWNKDDFNPIWEG